MDHAFVSRSFVQVLAQTSVNVLDDASRSPLRRSVHTREAIEISEGLSYEVALLE